MLYEVFSLANSFLLFLERKNRSEAKGRAHPVTGLNIASENFNLAELEISCLGTILRYEISPQTTTTMAKLCGFHLDSSSPSNTNVNVNFSLRR
jgi:hypothetical protein